MKIYIGTKIVLAEPIEEHEALFSVEGSVRSSAVSIDSTGHSRAGYKVIYEDGYVSWSPKDTFERAYREVTKAEKDLVAV